MTSAADTGEIPQSKPGPRGRGATGPTEIPAKGWKDILLRVFSEMGDDRVMLIAAGVTYYIILALVPALTALVSIFGLIADRATINENIGVISSFVPAGGMDIITEQLERLAGQDEATLGFALIFSIGIAIWSANAGVKAIFDAMNVAYDEKETRNFVKLTLTSLAFTLALIVGAICIIGVVLVLPAVLNFVYLGGQTELIIKIFSYIGMAVFFVAAIACIYRYGPDRDRAKWKWITPGAITAALVIAIVSVAFSWYVANFGSYNKTYGSLGALIGFITWIWISMTILILGAELNAEMEHQTARDSTVGSREPMGKRGAEMADDLGAKAGNIDTDSATSASIGPGGEDTQSTQSGSGRSLPLGGLVVMAGFAIAAGLLSRR